MGNTVGSGMIALRIGFVGLCALAAVGCVSSDTYHQVQIERDDARKARAITEADFDAYKKQTSADIETLRKKSAQEVASLKEEKAKLASDLEAVRTTAAKLQQALDEMEHDLMNEKESRKELENQTKKTQDKLQQSLAEANVRTTSLERDKEQLAAHLTQLRDQIKELTTKLATEQVKVAILREDKQRLLGGTTTAREEIGRMQATLQQQEERLRAVEAEKARLEQERSAKEADIQRLTKIQEELHKALEVDIAKGDIRITQIRDRLTINLLDRVLFESGQGQVKPGGLKALKQIADIIKPLSDKQVRIEGHTDNVPIGEKLRDKYPSNWELSIARTISVVRYLIEEGGANPALLSAAGHGDSRPIASNETEEGRKANRRIEITFYPKDAPDIAGQTKP